MPLLAASVSAHPESGPGKGHPATTDGLSVVHHVHRAKVLFRSAYELERWQKGPKRSDIRKAQEHRRAIRVAKTRKQLAEFRDKLAERFHDYAQEQQEVAALTPYPGPGGTRWAIPWPVVACESGGDWGAYNASSGATGPYQMLPSTYAGVCDTCDWSRPDQHLGASRVWARSGGSEWECA